MKLLQSVDPQRVKDCLEKLPKVRVGTYSHYKGQRSYQAVRMNGDAMSPSVIESLLPDQLNEARQKMKAGIKNLEDERIRKRQAEAARAATLKRKAQDQCQATLAASQAAQKTKRQATETERRQATIETLQEREKNLINVITLICD